MPKSEPEIQTKTSALGDVWHRYRFWIIAVIVVLLAAGARWEGTQELEAKLVGLAVPVLAVAMGVGRLRDAPLFLRRVAAIIGLFALLGAEAELGHVFFPSAPISTGNVSLKEPDTTLDVPTNRTAFEIESHGTLGTAHSAAEENFVIQFERDGHKTQIEGAFQRSPSVRFTRRRAPVNTSPHIVDVTLDTVELAGTGPIHAHLATLAGSGGKNIELRVRPALPGARLLALLLEALIAGALVVQILAAREGIRVRFLSWLAFALVLALYLPRHFSPDDPLGALIGALFVALIGGGIGGMVLGGLVGSFVKRRAEA